MTSEHKIVRNTLAQIVSAALVGEFGGAVGLLEGLARTATWYRENNLL